MSVNRRLLVPLTGAAVLTVVWFLANSVSSDPQSANSNKSASVSTAVADSHDAELAKKIEATINDGDATRARWGVFVASTKDGRVLYSRDGDKLFTPASNMKIFTTAVALDLLGADYRWRTSAYGAREIGAAGVLDGDLTLYGRGAPDLDSQKSLPALVDQLYQRGLRQVRGDVIGDESHLRAEMYGVGWQWNDLQWYYGAEPSALTIDENSVEVTIAPAGKTGASATVIANPNDYIRLHNRTTTGEREAVTSIGIHRELSGNDVKVWGEFPVGGRSFSAFLSVHEPALQAATILRRLLIARGIKVDGKARSRDFRVAEAERFDPRAAIEFAHVESAPLSEIVRKTNKESNNLYAELLLRTIGKERGASAPDPDARKNATRGDDAAGAAVVKKWLNDHGVASRDLAIHDGSGLSRLDLITPESAARLVIAMAKSQSAKSFRDSLPVSGRDGTLRGRLMPVAGKVLAKTGYLTYTHSLSGYVATANGEELAFSIICNDATGQSRAGRTIDALVMLLAEHGSAKSSK